MNEKESAPEKDVVVGFIEKEPSFDFNKITQTGINFLDNIVSNIEKEAKKQLKNKPDVIPETNEKVSKRKGKSEPMEYSEKPLETNEVQFEFDTTTLKQQYGFYAELMLSLLNPFLEKEGIDAITEKEIQELINAIFDIVGKYLSQIGASGTSSIKVMRNLRKWVNLLKAISGIFAPRIKPIQDLLIKNRAKKVVKKINQDTPL